MAKSKDSNGEVSSSGSVFDISSHPDFFRFVTDIMSVDKKIDIAGLTAEFDEDEQTTNTVAGRKLTYVKSRVLRKRLRDFTGGNYSFMILSEQRVSDPLPRYDRENKEYVDSPAYIKVVAMLAIPGLGVQIQYGVKQTFGVGESNDWKAAATDAFKKCCQGFGLEATYDEDNEDNASPNGSNKAPQKSDDDLEDSLGELEFDQELYEEALEEEVNFGKHKGLTLGEIWDEDPSYVEWIAKNAREEEMQEMALMVIKGKREEESSSKRKKKNNKKQESKAKPEPKKSDKRRPKEEDLDDEDEELIDDEDEEEEAPPPKKGNKKK